MIENLMNLCDHQDLVADNFATQRLDSVEIQAKYAENVSTKCIFLAEFLSLMQTEEKQIAILVRPSRMLEILEALFKWHGFVYNRADQPGSGYTGNPAGGPMTIRLIPTEGGISDVSLPSFIIAFDSTYRSVPYLNELRKDPLSPHGLVPLAFLMITHSVEHLDRCLDKSVVAIERKIKLVSCLTQIKDGVGKLGGEYHDPPTAARAVAEYLLNGATDGSWPLLPVPEIEGLDLKMGNSQSHIDGTQDQTVEFSSPSHPAPSTQLPLSIKRQLVSSFFFNIECMLIITRNPMMP